MLAPRCRTTRTRRAPPAPRAWTTRSGMRSWSKCMIFSRRWKSSSSVGPRRPAFSESSVCGDAHALRGGQEVAVLRGHLARPRHQLGRLRRVRDEASTRSLLVGRRLARVRSSTARCHHTLLRHPWEGASGTVPSIVRGETPAAPRDATTRGQPQRERASTPDAVVTTPPRNGPSARGSCTCPGRGRRAGLRSRSRSARPPSASSSRRSRSSRCRRRPSPVRGG